MRVRNHIDAEALLIILHKSLLEITLRIPVRFDFDRLLAATGIDFHIGLIICTYSVVARTYDTGQCFAHLAEI